MPLQMSGPALRIVFGLHRDRNAAPNPKIANHFTPGRIEGLYQIVEQHITHVFVKNALVAKTPKIHFERLGFHNFSCRDIADGNFSKIWLASSRAQATKLIRRQRDHIIAPGVMVRKCLELLTRLVLRFAYLG